MSNLQPPTARMPEPSPSLDGHDPAAKKPDPFDPEMLRVEAIADIEVERVLTTLPVRKPKRNEFFRVHPGHNYTVDMYLLERDTGMDKESFLVAPEVQHLVVQELRRVRLFTAINKHGNVFLWPVKLATGDNDRIHRVTDSALLCAEEARSLWVKLVWNRDLGAYEMHRARGDLGTPQWPDKSFRDLIEIAFRHNVIDQADHPVIQELSGQI